MRLLRALFNFAAGKYEDAQGRSLITENPVKRLSQTRAWYRVERRQTYIQTHELKAWYQAVQKLENHSLRDYFMLVILTGLRRQEAASLRWKQVHKVIASPGVIFTIHDLRRTFITVAESLDISAYALKRLLKHKMQNDVLALIAIVCIVCVIIMNSKDIIKLLERNGWFKHHQKGCHCQYKHPTKMGKVTVPHPKKDLPIKTVQSILNASWT